MHQGIYFAKQAGGLSFNSGTSMCMAAAVKGRGDLWEEADEIGGGENLKSS